MDPQVWKHLGDHDEILRLVLYRVPWDTNLRFRSVSKSWNDMLSEPSFLTWTSMLTDRSFYADHPEIEWVGSSPVRGCNGLETGESTSKIPEQGLPDPVCLLSISQNACAVANFKTHRWCKLPPLVNLPSSQWDNLNVTGTADGLLLLEGNPAIPVRRVDVCELDVLYELYELDRFLLNPMTMEFVKLPPVPFDPEFNELNPDLRAGFLRYPMILTVDEDQIIRVVAIEYSIAKPKDRRIRRILIWQQYSDGWETLKTHYTTFRKIAATVQNVVFAHGELFLHTVFDPLAYWSHRTDAILWHIVINCKRDSVDIGDSDSSPIIHFFRHRGALKRLTGMWKVGKDPPNSFQQRQSQYMLLSKFDHSTEKWEVMTKMPSQMVKQMCASLSDRFASLSDGDAGSCFIRVEGDILCIGNHFKTHVLFLCNLLSLTWTEVCAKSIDIHVKSNQELFLWSPKQRNKAAEINLQNYVQKVKDFKKGKIHQ
ncbi:hypothetical protein R1sor_004032 [Riccia sorocarpa]|uniref:F-box domain-containing protein n=1 Tax=Riccia sorocarpa TaxID=122646 RepID=A0ABD3H3C9_9MARC